MNLDLETFKKLYTAIESKKKEKKKVPLTLLKKTCYEDSFPVLIQKKPVIRIPRFKPKKYLYRKKYRRFIDKSFKLYLRLLKQTEKFNTGLLGADELENRNKFIYWLSDWLKSMGFHVSFLEFKRKEKMPYTGGRLWRRHKKKQYYLKRLRRAVEDYWLLFRANKKYPWKKILNQRPEILKQARQWEDRDYWHFLIGRIKEHLLNVDPESQTLAQLDDIDTRANAFRKSRQKLSNLFEEILNDYENMGCNLRGRTGAEHQKKPLIAHINNYRDVTHVIPYLAGYLPLTQTIYLVSPAVTWCFQEEDNVIYYKGLREPSYYINKGYLNNPRNITVKPFYGRRVQALNEPIPEEVLAVTKDTVCKQINDSVFDNNNNKVSKKRKLRRQRKFMDRIGFPYEYYRTFSTVGYKNPIASFGAIHLSFIRFRELKKLIADIDNRFFRQYIPHDTYEQSLSRILTDMKVNKYLLRRNNYLKCEDWIGQQFSLFPLKIVKFKKHSMPNPILMSVIKSKTEKKRMKYLGTFISFRKPKPLNYDLFEQLFGSSTNDDWQELPFQNYDDLPTYQLKFTPPEFETMPMCRKETFIEPKYFLEPASPLLLRANPFKMKLDALIFQFSRIHYLYKYFISTKELEEKMAEFGDKDDYEKNNVNTKRTRFGPADDEEQFPIKSDSSSSEEDDDSDANSEEENQGKEKADIRKLSEEHDQTTDENKEMSEVENIPSEGELFQNLDFVQYPDILQTKHGIFNAKQQLIIPMFEKQKHPASPFPLVLSAEKSDLTDTFCKKYLKYFKDLFPRDIKGRTIPPIILATLQIPLVINKKVYKRKLTRKKLKMNRMKKPHWAKLREVKQDASKKKEPVRPAVKGKEEAAKAKENVDKNKGKPAKGILKNKSPRRDEKEILLKKTQEHLKRASKQADEELQRKLLLLEKVKETQSFSFETKLNLEDQEEVNYEMKAREMIEELKEKYNIVDQEVSIEDNIDETMNKTKPSEPEAKENSSVDSVLVEDEKRAAYKVVEQRIMEEGYNFKAYLREDDMYKDIKPKNIFEEDDEEEEQALDNIQFLHSKVTKEKKKKEVKVPEYDEKALFKAWSTIGPKWHFFDMSAYFAEAKVLGAESESETSSIYARKVPPALFNTIPPIRKLTSKDVLPVSTRYQWSFLEDEEGKPEAKEEEAVVVQPEKEPVAVIEEVKTRQNLTVTFKGDKKVADMASASTLSMMTSEEKLMNDKLTHLRRPKAPTVCIFGSVDMWEDSDFINWAHDTKSMSFTKKNLYGKGIEKCKGPLMAWLFAIRTLIKRRTKLPVHLKLVLNAIELTDSKAMMRYVKKTLPHFLEDVDYILTINSIAVARRTPTIMYGGRGMCQFQIEITNKDEGSKLRLASTKNKIPNIMSDLIYMMNNITHLTEAFKKYGITEYTVCEGTNVEELKLYHKPHHCNIHSHEGRREIRRAIKQLDNENLRLPECEACWQIKKDRKQRRLVVPSSWFQPHPTLHGFNIVREARTKRENTSIPMKVVGKFTIHYMNNVTPPIIKHIVRKYLRSVWIKRKNEQKYEDDNRLYMLKMTYSTRPWLAQTKHPLISKIKKVLYYLYGRKPYYCSFDCFASPIVPVLQALTNKPFCAIAFPNNRFNKFIPNKVEKYSLEHFRRNVNFAIAVLRSLKNVASKQLVNQFERQSKLLRREGENRIQLSQYKNYEGILNFAYHGLYSKFKRHYRPRPTQLTKIKLVKTDGTSTKLFGYLNENIKKERAPHGKAGNLDDASSVMSLEYIRSDVDVQSDGDLKRINHEDYTEVEKKLLDMPDWSRCKKFIKNMLKSAMRRGFKRMRKRTVRRLRKILRRTFPIYIQRRKRTKFGDLANEIGMEHLKYPPPVVNHYIYPGQPKVLRRLTKVRRGTIIKDSEKAPHGILEPHWRPVKVDKIERLFSQLERRKLKTHTMKSIFFPLQDSEKKGYKEKEIEPKKPNVSIKKSFLRKKSWRETMRRKLSIIDRENQVKRKMTIKKERRTQKRKSRKSDAKNKIRNKRNSLPGRKQFRESDVDTDKTNSTAVDTNESGLEPLQDQTNGFRTSNTLRRSRNWQSLYRKSRRKSLRQMSRKKRNEILTKYHEIIARRRRDKVKSGTYNAVMHSINRYLLALKKHKMEKEGMTDWEIKMRVAQLVTSKTKEETRLMAFKKLLKKKLLIRRREKLFIWLQKVDYDLYLKQMPKDKTQAKKYKSLFQQMWKKFKAVCQVLTVRSYSKKQEKLKNRTRAERRLSMARRAIKAGQKGRRNSAKLSRTTVVKPDPTDKKKSTENKKESLEKKGTDKKGSVENADQKGDKKGSVEGKKLTKKEKDMKKKGFVMKHGKWIKSDKKEFAEKPSCPVRRGERYVTIYGNTSKRLPLEVRLPEALIRKQQRKESILPIVWREPNISNMLKGDAYSQDSVTSIEELELQRQESQEMDHSSSDKSTVSEKKMVPHIRWSHTKVFKGYKPFAGNTSVTYHILKKDLSTANFKGTKKVRIYCILKGMNTNMTRSLPEPEIVPKKLKPLVPLKRRVLNIRRCPCMEKWKTKLLSPALKKELKHWSRCQCGIKERINYYLVRQNEKQKLLTRKRVAPHKPKIVAPRPRLPRIILSPTVWHPRPFEHKINNRAFLRKNTDRLKIFKKNYKRINPIDATLLTKQMRGEAIRDFIVQHPERQKSFDLFMSKLPFPPMKSSAGITKLNWNNIPKISTETKFLKGCGIYKPSVEIQTQWTLTINALKVLVSGRALQPVEDGNETQTYKTSAQSMISGKVLKCNPKHFASKKVPYKIAGSKFIKYIHPPKTDLKSLFPQNFDQEVQTKLRGPYLTKLRLNSPFIKEPNVLEQLELSYFSNILEKYSHENDDDEVLTISKKKKKKRSMVSGPKPSLRSRTVKNEGFKYTDLSLMSYEARSTRVPEFKPKFRFRKSFWNEDTTEMSISDIIEDECEEEFSDFKLSDVLLDTIKQSRRMEHEAEECRKKKLRQPKKPPVIQKKNFPLEEIQVSFAESPTAAEVSTAPVMKMISKISSSTDYSFQDLLKMFREEYASNKQVFTERRAKEDSTLHYERFKRLKEELKKYRKMKRRPKKVDIHVEEYARIPDTKKDELYIECTQYKPEKLKEPVILNEYTALPRTHSLSSQDHMTAKQKFLDVMKGYMRSLYMIGEVRRRRPYGKFDMYVNPKFAIRKKHLSVGHKRKHHKKATETVITDEKLKQRTAYFMDNVLLALMGDESGEFPFRRSLYLQLFSSSSDSKLPSSAHDSGLKVLLDELPDDNEDQFTKRHSKSMPVYSPYGSSEFSAKSWPTFLESPSPSRKQIKTPPTFSVYKPPVVPKIVLKEYLLPKKDVKEAKVYIKKLDEEVIETEVPAILQDEVKKVHYLLPESLTVSSKRFRPKDIYEHYKWKHLVETQDNPEQEVVEIRQSDRKVSFDGEQLQLEKQELKKKKRKSKASYRKKESELPNYMACVCPLVGTSASSKKKKSISKTRSVGRCPVYKKGYKEADRMWKSVFYELGVGKKCCLLDLHNRYGQFIRTLRKLPSGANTTIVGTGTWLDQRTKHQDAAPEKKSDKCVPSKLPSYFGDDLIDIRFGPSTLKHLVTTAGAGKKSRGKMISVAPAKKQIDKTNPFLPIAAKRDRKTVLVDIEVDPNEFLPLSLRKPVPLGMTPDSKIALEDGDFRLTDKTSSLRRSRDTVFLPRGSRSRKFSSVRRNTESELVDTSSIHWTLDSEGDIIREGKDDERTYAVKDIDADRQELPTDEVTGGISFGKTDVAGTQGLPHESETGIAIESKETERSRISDSAEIISPLWKTDMGSLTAKLRAAQSSSAASRRTVSAIILATKASINARRKSDIISSVPSRTVSKIILSLKSKHRGRMSTKSLPFAYRSSRDIAVGEWLQHNAPKERKPRFTEMERLLAAQEKSEPELAQSLRGTKIKCKTAIYPALSHQIRPLDSAHRVGKVKTPKKEKLSLPTDYITANIVSPSLLRTVYTEIPTEGLDETLSKEALLKLHGAIAGHSMDHYHRKKYKKFHSDLNKKPRIKEKPKTFMSATEKLLRSECQREKLYIDKQTRKMNKINRFYEEQQIKEEKRNRKLEKRANLKKNTPTV